MSKSIITKEQAEEICKKSNSIADFCRHMGWQPRGGNYKVVHKYIKQFNLDVSHFTGQRTNIGNVNNIGLSKEEFFKKGKLIRSADIIKKILKEKLKEYKCEICGISEWQGKPLRLQVHHKDGDHLNNEIDNLEFLCPNCHSQTDTFAGKSNLKGKLTCTHKKEWKYTCNKCGKHLCRKPKTGYCAECLRKSYKKIY